jgi:hypothetical protein
MLLSSEHTVQPVPTQIQLGRNQKLKLFNLEKLNPPIRTGITKKYHDKSICYYNYIIKLVII